MWADSFQRESHIKANEKRETHEYKSVSFPMSYATSGLKSIKKLCTQWTVKSKMRKSELSGNGQCVLY